MLLAGHIKPWKDSSPAERLDPQNGLAACPSHDVAFDTGLLTVSAELKIHIAPSLADAVRGDDLTRQYYGRPPLLETLLLPDGAKRPARKYLDWHREKIFTVNPNFPLSLGAEGPALPVTRHDLPSRPPTVVMYIGVS